MNHSLMVVQTVLTATFNSYGDRQISTPPPQNGYPWTQKIQHNWLRPWGDPYTKFGTNPATGGFWANGWNITKIIFVFLPSFSDSPTGHTRWSIFMRDSSKDVKSRKDMPFGGLNDAPLNFWGKTPKNWNFGAWKKQQTTKNSNPYNLKTT